MKSSKRTMTTNNFDPLFESKSIKSTKIKGDFKHRNKHYFDCLNEDILSLNNNSLDIGDYSHGKIIHHDRRFMIYVLFLILICFIVYRCSIFLWTKPKKTFFEQCLENLSRFLTL